MMSKLETEVHRQAQAETTKGLARLRHEQQREILQHHKMHQVSISQLSRACCLAWPSGDMRPCVLLVCSG